jgi:hypothetical protein
MLDAAAKHGATCHLYMTEMSLVERGLRMLARSTDARYGQLRHRDMPPGDERDARAFIDTLPYGATLVSDWPVADVCADIRAAKWDVCCVDLLHGFDYQDERELSGHVNALSAAASASTADGPGTAILLACHLNDGQMRDRSDVRRPRPGLHSLKGASSIKQRADVVMFVWQEDDDAGLPSGNGEVWIAKSRSGATASQQVQLDPRHMRFEPRQQLEGVS